MDQKISVIIPTYNREHLLGRAVKSVQLQTYKNIEIIIVDDASTDQTYALIERMREEDSRIISLRLEENGGAARARNKGVENAQGEWIAFQDSDDIWHKDKLEKQLAYAFENPEYRMVYHPFWVKTKTEEGKYPRDDMRDLSGNIYEALLKRNTIGTPTMLLKKADFLEMGGFEASMESLEDWEFALRFAYKYKIGYLNEILVDTEYIEQDRLSARGDAFLKGRLRMIVRHREELLARGIFDEVLLELFQNAEKQNLLNETKQLFMLMLQEERSK